MTNGQGWNLPPLLQQVKLYLQQAVSTGGQVIDCTVGNGYDTLFLAEQVGDTGHVYGFDIQQTALDAARSRLLQANLEERVTFFHAGHERIAELVPQHLKGQIQAATFNLGYLPGGDKGIVTKPDTTITALDSVFDWLKPGGIITVMLYNGHPGGDEEQTAVLEWSKQLEQRRAQVLWSRFLNQRNDPPTLLTISKNK